MSVERIDLELCNGCGICVNSCATDVLRLDAKTNKAYVAYPEECNNCDYCELDCPTNAIYISPERHMPLIVGW
jgi:NAD-dependent dihydropyrimidine dehydrogenase PreA subunit